MSDWRPVEFFSPKNAKKMLSGKLLETLVLTHISRVKAHVLRIPKICTVSCEHQVIFWPDNIVGLFERFGVKKNFDFLSEDSDSYDFFMTEAILEVELNLEI